MKNILLTMSIVVNIILFFIIDNTNLKFNIGDVVEVTNDRHCRGVGIIIGLIDSSKTGRTSLGLEYIVHMPFCNANYIISQENIKE